MRYLYRMIQKPWGKIYGMVQLTKKHILHKNVWAEMTRLGSNKKIETWKENIVYLEHCRKVLLYRNAYNKRSK